MQELLKTQEKPHHLGHRKRLRERFLKSAPGSLPDYELLEIILFAAKPRSDVKPLAKKLLSEFGSISKVLSAPVNDLRKITEMGDGAIAALKAAQEASLRVLQEKVAEKPILQSWKALLDYCRASMGHNKKEQFRIFFLDKKNKLIADELQQEGTVDHTPVYPREVVKRALELGASAIILVHNHPSGDVTPSRSDIDMTKYIMQASTPLNVIVHDHIIVAADNHYSFKSNGLI